MTRSMRSTEAISSLCVIADARGRAEQENTSCGMARGDSVGPRRVYSVVEVDTVF